MFFFLFWIMSLFWLRLFICYQAPTTDLVYTLASANIDKLGQTKYDQQISKEFDYESTWTGTVGVTCSWILKIAEFDLFYTRASTNINQSASNFVKIYMIIRSWVSSIKGRIGINNMSYLPFNSSCCNWLGLHSKDLHAYMMQT